jgi:hypothetical protein
MWDQCLVCSLCHSSEHFSIQISITSSFFLILPWWSYFLISLRENRNNKKARSQVVHTTFNPATSFYVWYERNWLDCVLFCNGAQLCHTGMIRRSSSILTWTGILLGKDMKGVGSKDKLIIKLKNEIFYSW